MHHHHHARCLVDNFFFYLDITGKGKDGQIMDMVLRFLLSETERKDLCAKMWHEVSLLVEIFTFLYLIP